MNDVVNLDDATESDSAAILRLSKLSEIEYDRVREKAAEDLGIRVSVLDRNVESEKNETATTKSKGKKIELYEPELWPDPVNGSEVLTEAANHIIRHMVIREADAYTCALWAAHTFLFDEFDHSPRLLITAPDAECGKTVLMTHMVGNLVNKPQTVELMKPAPFFRMAEHFKPTFLIDEGDVFVRDDMELLAALNNGWEPHGGVIRCVGDDFEPKHFSTFCPTAIAGIELHKKLPTTTISRSVVINLDKAAEGELEDQDIYNRKLHRHGLLETGRKLARWIHDNKDEIRNHTPELPDGVRNRLAEKWTPLFSIAEVAGGDWPAKVKQALFGQIDLSEPTKAQHLLMDIRNVIDPVGDISTETLINRICNLEDSPWREYNFRQYDEDKKRITDRQISNLLKKYKLKPDRIRVNANQKQVRGYKRAELEKVWSRYLPSSPAIPEISVTASQVNKSGPLSEAACVTDNISKTDDMISKPIPDKVCDTVTDKTGDISDAGDYTF